MDRLAKLRHRQSAGAGLNASSTSLGAGYETANDESATSGCSMYYSMTDGEETGPQAEEMEAAETSVGKDEQTLSAGMTRDSSIDQTLENDFSVEEVSTIRKPVLAQASPATVKLASKMTVKYVGVSSTPARAVRSVKLKTPGGSGRKNLSGIAKLDESDDKRSLSILDKMREPKISECSSADDGDESKQMFEQSALEIAVATGNNKSYGTNVLANFFASLDVNKSTPVPEIRVSVPEEEQDKTPVKRRESNSLQNFFESLKKNPNEPEKENKPLPERRKSVRKSLIPKAPEERAKTRTSILATASGNRVASPIAKVPRKSSLLKLIPDRLKEMRRANQSDLVSFKRKSVIPPAPQRVMAVAVPAKVEPIQKLQTPEEGGPKEDIVGDSVMVVGSRKSIMPAPRPVLNGKTTLQTNAMKRKSVVPMAVVARRSVLPAKTVRRSVVPSMGLAPSKVSLKIPSKTTLASSDTSRRSSLGKRSITLVTMAKVEPVAKLRKSLAPVKETTTEVSAKLPETKPATSRIRPPTAAATSTTTMAFKKPETFTCDTCQRPFRLKSSLESHKKLVHQNGSPSPTSSPTDGNNKSADTSLDTKCRYCAKSFATSKILSNHIISNCLKIPVLEKRKLLAQNDQQVRAATAKPTPEASRPNQPTGASRLVRPATTSALTRPRIPSAGSNRSNSSNRSVDGGGTASDTSTCSSIGDTSANNSNNNNSSTNRKRPATINGGVRKRTVGHTGITRTPKKEMKCHLCSRKFLNAVEYALHVQAHAQGLESLKRDAKAPAPEQKEDSNGLVHLEDAAAILEKLATFRNKVNKK